jgi:hypothetical protein
MQDDEVHAFMESELLKPHTRLTAIIGWLKARAFLDVQSLQSLHPPLLCVCCCCTCACRRMRYWKHLHVDAGAAPCLFACSFFIGASKQLLWSSNSATLCRSEATSASTTPTFLSSSFTKVTWQRTWTTNRAH